MKVLTLNLWNRFGPWQQRRREIVHWVEVLQPDVICVQEVVAGCRAQLDELLDPLAEHDLVYQATYGGSPYSGALLGNAILTRGAHRSLPSFLLPAGEPEEPRRKLVGVDLGFALVICTHLAAHRGSEPYRAAQLDALRSHLADLQGLHPGCPIVLAGDLNCSPDSPELRRLLKKDSEPRLLDAWALAGSGEGLTWDESNPFTEELDPPLPPGRRDYVLVSDGAARPGVASARVVCEQPLTGVHASDHFGLIVDLEVDDEL